MSIAGEKALGLRRASARNDHPSRVIVTARLLLSSSDFRRQARPDDPSDTPDETDYQNTDANPTPLEAAIVATEEAAQIIHIAGRAPAERNVASVQPMEQRCRRRRLTQPGLRLSTQKLDPRVCRERTRRWRLQGGETTSTNADAVGRQAFAQSTAQHHNPTHCTSASPHTFYEAIAP